MGCFSNLHVTQMYLWRGCDFFRFIIVPQVQPPRTFPRTNSLSPVRSKVNQGVGGGGDVLSSFILLICLRGTTTNRGTWLQIGSMRFESRVV